MILREIVERNLEKMKGGETGCMRPLILDESIGGNAGNWQEHSCAAANFYYDAKTGEIICFGNCQKVPGEIREKFLQGTFRIAVDMRKTGRYRIIDAGMGSQVQDTARETLEASIEEFNRRYGFEVKTLVER